MKNNYIGLHNYCGIMMYNNIHRKLRTYIPYSILHCVIVLPYNLYVHIMYIHRKFYWCALYNIEF